MDNLKKNQYLKSMHVNAESFHIVIIAADKNEIISSMVPTIKNTKK